MVVIKFIILVGTTASSCYDDDDDDDVVLFQEDNVFGTNAGQSNTLLSMTPLVLVFFSRLSGYSNV